MNLSVRQAQVVALMADGLCDRQIALRLGVSIGTAKTHAQAVFTKLGTSKRAGAVATALRRGLIK